MNDGAQPVACRAPEDELRPAPAHAPARSSRAHAPLRARGRAGAGRMRELDPADLPALARLHRRVFGEGAPSAPGGRPAGGSGDRLEELLGEILCRHPWPDSRLASRVWEEDGEIVGFLGVMPRPMTFEGKPVLAAIGHNFMVRPDRRSSLGAIELVRAFMTGPQDLSLAEGTDTSRRLWKALGGTVAPAFSLRWTRPLEPARYALALLARRGVGAASWLRPLGTAADLVAAKVPRSPFRRGAGVASGADEDGNGGAALETEPLDAAGLAEAIGRHARPFPLAPRYDAAELDWMLGVLDRHSARGTLTGRLLRRDGEIAGWYLYYLRPHGIAETIQIGAAEDDAPEVVDLLFEELRASGAVAASGRLDPPLMPALSARHCLIHRVAGPHWLLAHGRDERLVRAVHTGEALLTRLEGEWWA